MLEAIACQPGWLQRAVGWMLPVGKGGARRAGDTDGSIHPAALCVQNTPDFLSLPNNLRKQKGAHR